ncbi:PIN domain-containing protein [Candidatus Curtissbacteria bacterium]|nr:PIN domain-containing protein [Candidatus Curtissbacteria bacterium]
MTRTVIDANAFLRLLLDDIPSQADQIQKILLEAKKNKKELLVPQIIIFEIVFALEKYYHFPKQKIVDNIKSILAMRYFKIQDREIFKRAIDLFDKKNVSLTDCFLVYFVQHNDANLFSFDKDLKKLQ